MWGVWSFCILVLQNVKWCLQFCTFLPSPVEATADTILAGYPAQHWPLLPVRMLALDKSCKVSRDTVYSFQFILQCFSFYFSIEFRGGGGTQCSHGIIGAGKESENVELNCSRQFNINILNGYTIYDNRNLFSIIKQKPDCLEICFNSQQCIRRGGVSNFVSFAMCCTLVS